MSPPDPAGPSTARRVGAALLLVLVVAWAALVHHGLGPRPDLELHWWSPRGFLSRALLGSPLAGLLVEPGRGFRVFWLPAVALAAGVWMTTRSALARAAALCAVLATAVFLFFALGSEAARLAWSLFHWRASGTMLATATAVGLLLASPWLAASWLRLRWPARLAWFAALAFAVIAIERNVTGTNPRLPFAISPWPAVQIFGLDVAGTTVAALLGAAGLGAGSAACWRQGRRAVALALAALGFAAPAVWLAMTSGSVPPFLVALARWPAALLAGFSGGRIPARVEVGAAFYYLAGLALAAPAPIPRLRGAFRTLGTAALLVAIPIGVGQAWSRLDYTRNRDVRAQQAIDALASYYQRESIYPEALQALVESKDLDAVPRPRVGFGFLADDTRFTYQGFGTSYLLEFPAPRWVQCAYNPPYEEEEGEEAEGRGEGEHDEQGAAGEEDMLAGAWSCPSAPPELW